MGEAEEGKRGERVSWKLRETRVRGARKGVASGDGKGRTRKHGRKRSRTGELHTPSRGSGWRIKKSFRKFISGTLPERRG